MDITIVPLGASKGAEEAAECKARAVVAVGLDGYCSPRHRLRFH